MRFGHWSDPADSDVHADDHDTGDPETLGVVGAVEAEEDGKTDAAEITGGTGDARYDAVRVRVHVRHEGKVGAVTGLEEDSHAGDQAEQGGFVVGIGLANGDKEGSADNTHKENPSLLGPQVLGEVAVDKVTHNASQRTSDDVQKTEHGGPSTRPGLAQVREVLQVVGAKVRVDGQLTAEGAEVGGSVEQSLQRENDVHAFPEGWLHDDFAASDVQHLTLGHVCFPIVRDWGGRFLALFLIHPGGRRARVGLLFVHDDSLGVSGGRNTVGR